jgi:hypothetical protein
MLRWNKTYLGIVILIYAFSVAICASEFNEANRLAGNDHTPDIYCGIDLNTIVPTDDRRSAIIDSASGWNLTSRIIEPHLPILAFAIFKIPKSA